MRSRISYLSLFALFFASSLGCTPVTFEELVTRTDESMVITWVTEGMESSTGILYGISPDSLDHSYVIEELVVYHYLELTGLYPGTQYFYKVFSEASDGQGYEGPLRDFTTLEPPEGAFLFKFASMNDPHIGLTNSIFLAEQTIEEVLDHGPEFTIIKGDLTSNATPEQLETAREVLNGLGEMYVDYFPLMGNHDLFWDGLIPHDEDFRDVFGFGEEKRLCYSFDFEGYHFIGMDSVWREPFLLDGSESGSGPVGGFTEEDLAWLGDDLSMHQGSPAMIFMHHPVTQEAATTALWPFVMTVNPEDATAFMTSIGGYENVAGVFCGHTHRNKVTHEDEITGSLPYPETAATVEYPCGYNIYKVYEGGYMQSFYKCRDCLEYSETNRKESYLGLGAPYRFGTEEADRNFIYEIPFLQ